MNFPTFLLQSGDVMSREKIACSFSEYPIRYLSYEGLDKLPPKEYSCYVPVGSVEYIRKYCTCVGLALPGPLFFLDILEPYYHRKVRVGTLSDSSPGDFVKPAETTKLFSGCPSYEVSGKYSGDTPVLISEIVVFESEFRFYIHDFVSGPKVLGWARYDNKQVTNPAPDISLVEEISGKIHDILGPNAYSIDIGWRKDLQKYSLVEVNDGWSLGLYENTDPQSAPPLRRDYAEMLVSRWRQIVFCNIV